MKLFTILCCINPTGSIDDIDEFTFYQMINPITPVINIKIFDRGSQVKAFVQIEDEEVAEKVIKDLHGKQMNIGKIKVFVSHKKFIAFDKPLPQILAQANRSSMEHVNIDQPTVHKPALGGNPYLSNSVSGFKNKTQSYSSWKMYQKPVQVPNYSDKVLYSKPSQLDYDTTPSIYVTKKLVNNTQPVLQVTHTDSADQLYGPTEGSDPVQIRHVKVTNVNLKVVTKKMMFNLFGCFGNVPRLLIQSDLGLAVIEYQTETQARMAVKYTDCIRFCEKILNVGLYSGPDLFEDNVKRGVLASTVHLNEPTNYRFTPESGNQATAPSRILKIVGLPKDATDKTIKQLLGKGQQFLNITSEKSQKNKETTFFIEFNFLYESIKVLTLLHNTEHEGKTLTVSFFKRQSNTS